jgi:hypothetical protein
MPVRSGPLRELGRGTDDDLPEDLSVRLLHRLLSPLPILVRLKTACASLAAMPVSPCHHIADA